MHGKFGLLSLGKASSHSTALPSFLFFPVCSAFVRHTLLWQMDMGSLVCTQFWVHAVNMKGVRHKSGLERTEKLPLTLPCQGIEPRAFGFEFRCSNHWAMSSPFINFQICSMAMSHTLNSTYNEEEQTLGWLACVKCDRRYIMPSFKFVPRQEKSSCQTVILWFATKLDVTPNSCPHKLQQHYFAP